MIGRDEVICAAIGDRSLRLVEEPRRFRVGPHEAVEIVGFFQRREGMPVAFGARVPSRAPPVELDRAVFVHWARVGDIDPQQVVIETIGKLFDRRPEVLGENPAHLRGVIGLHRQPVHRFPPQRAEEPRLAVMVAMGWVELTPVCMPQFVLHVRSIRGTLIEFAVQMVRLRGFLPVQKRSSSRRSIAQNPDLALAGRNHATALLHSGLHSGHVAK